MKKFKIKKGIFIALGCVSLSLGIIGIVAPILPTTPFLLLASYLFVHSSKKLHAWLMAHPVFGEMILSYIRYKALRMRTKIQSILLLWISLSISIYLIDLIWLQGMLIFIGGLVTSHIWSLNTLTEDLLVRVKTDQNQVEAN